MGRPLKEIEKEAIIQRLDEFDGNRTKTAKDLKIGLRTLQRKLIAYDLSNYKRVWHNEHNASAY